MASSPVYRCFELGLNERFDPWDLELVDPKYERYDDIMRYKLAQALKALRDQMHSYESDEGINKFAYSLDVNTREGPVVIEECLPDWLDNIPDPYWLPISRYCIKVTEIVYYMKSSTPVQTVWDFMHSMYKRRHRPVEPKQ